MQRVDSIYTYMHICVYIFTGTKTLVFLPPEATPCLSYTDFTEHRYTHDGNAFTGAVTCVHMIDMSHLYVACMIEYIGLSWAISSSQSMGRYLAYALAVSCVCVGSQLLYLHPNLIERTPPPPGGFLFSMFPDQEPGGNDLQLKASYGCSPPYYQAIRVSQSIAPYRGYTFIPII